MAEFSNNRKLGNRSTDSVTPQDFGAKADGTTDDLAAFNAMATYAIAAGLAMDLGSTRPGKTNSKYRLSGKWLVTGYSGDIFSKGAIIQFDSAVNDTAVEFENGTPNLIGTLRIFRSKVGATFNDDWTGSYSDTIGLKVNLATRIHWGHLDIQGFAKGLQCDCDGSTSGAELKRFTECSIEQLDITNCLICWDIPSDNSGYFTDVNVTRLRLGGGNVNGVANAIGINCVSGTTGNIQGPNILSYNISDLSGTGAKGIYYDSRRTLSIGDGWFESNTTDIDLPTPTQAGTLSAILIGYNLDEKFVTISNASGRSISSRAFSMGCKATGDSLSSFSLALQAGTDIGVEIFNPDSAGQQSAYNHKLNHSAVQVVKNSSNTASSTEGTITYELNTAGTELIIQLPGLTQRGISATVVFDGSGATKTPVVEVAFTSITPSANWIKLKFYDGATPFDLSTISSSLILSVLVVRQSLLEQNP